MTTIQSRDLTLLTELARRAVALALFIAAAVLGLGYGQTLVALLALVAGGLVYILVPRPKLPHDAIHHERMPTVVMPDILGFMLATLFFSLPLIISAQQPWSDGPFGFYLMTGIPGLIACAIFWIATRHQCLWLVATGHDLTIADMRRIETLAYHDIEKVELGIKPPPGWLSPLLVLFGGWRGLGIALLTGERPSHALKIHLRDGTQRRIPSDALADQGIVAGAMLRGGVKLDSKLAALAQKAERKRRVRRQHDHHAARTGGPGRV